MTRSQEEFMGYKICSQCGEQILIVTGKSEYCAWCGGKLIDPRKEEQLRTSTPKVKTE